MRWFGWLKQRGAKGIGGNTGSTVVIGGRKRTAGIPYMLPADMEEINRLDFQHYLLRHAFQGNYAAPIRRPTSILDVGTGTGRWAREMAAAFPQARVVGLDINPPPTDAPDLNPPNYAFILANVLEGLPFPDASFDFVHMRLMVLALPADRWAFVVNELARVTQPGGWVESVEYGGEKNGGAAVGQLMRWGTQASALRGIDTSYHSRVGELMRAAGLANVLTHELDIPLGTWGGRVGSMEAVNLVSAQKALSSIYIARDITTEEEFERVIHAAQLDMRSPSYRGLCPFYIACGQRVR